MLNGAQILFCESGAQSHQPIKREERENSTVSEIKDKNGFLYLVTVMQNLSSETQRQLVSAVRS